MEKARSTEFFQSMSYVVTTALGGRKQKLRAPKTGAEAEAMFGGVFGAPIPVESRPDMFAGLDSTFKKLETVGEKK